MYTKENIPIDKVTGRLGTDDFPLLNTLDKMLKQRNSANTSSGGGSYDNI